jgi:hypothetical protein
MDPEMSSADRQIRHRASPKFVPFKGKRGIRYCRTLVDDLDLPEVA